MKYQFLGFELDADSRQLLHEGKPLSLSKRNFDLLLKLIQNPGVVFSREQLIEELWAGRVVGANSLDQSISKIRKLLGSYDGHECIETVHGHGFRWTTEVQTVAANHSPAKPARPVEKAWYSRPWVAVLVVALIASIAWFIAAPPFDYELDEVTSNTPVAMPSDLPLIAVGLKPGQSGDLLLTNGMSEMLGQVLRLGGLAEIQSVANIDEDILKEQNDEARQLVPDQSRIYTELSQKADQFELSLEGLGSDGQALSYRGHSSNLGVLLLEATGWLNITLGGQASLDEARSLIPDDSFVVESYMRGLASMAAGEIDAAGRYFELNLEQSPDFHLARLELARVRFRQGQPDASLAMLDTFDALIDAPTLRIASVALRGNVLGISGDQQGAKQLYLATLEQYEGQNYPELEDVRYNLAETLTFLGELNAALQQADILAKTVNAERRPELLAHVYHRQASLYLETGNTAQAVEKAQAALLILTRLNDVLGQAKTLSMLARIYILQAEYAEAENYLQQALSIAEQQNFPLGVGATLNEMTHLALVQGKFSDADAMNQRMLQIAVEIDYPAMVQASRLTSAEIASGRKDWAAAQRYMDSHLEFAESANDARMVVRNQQQRVDWYLGQKLAEPIEPMLLDIQKYIEANGEARMQPGLNLQKARWLILKDDNPTALALLTSNRELAKQNNDRETLQQIDVVASQYWLDHNQPQRALAMLDRSDINAGWQSPGRYRLCARANKQLEQPVAALDCLNRFRQQANEHWNSFDEELLLELNQQVSSTTMGSE